ncbi:hypothetical protein X777_01404, partial [Ooceraea biroi]
MRARGSDLPRTNFPGKFSPFFRTLELLVRFDLQCINEKFLYGVRPVCMVYATLLELNYY